MRKTLAVLGLAALPLTWPVAASATVSAGQAPAPAFAPVALTLAAPTGSDRIGTVSLHLIDPSRRDPWVPDHPVRELMISIWYPATDAARYPPAPWMLPGAGAHFLAGLGIPAGAVTLPPTAGHQGAPVDRSSGARPVLLYSPGSHTDRTIDTALVQDLASRGYIVVTVDRGRDHARRRTDQGRRRHGRHVLRPGGHDRP